jgi:hypothetical protein
MSHKKKEPTRFIKGGMMRVESVCNHLGPNESLRAQLAPHGVSNAENGVLLGRTGRFPLERYLAQIGFVLVRLEGACHQRRRIPPRELSIDLVADERLGRATGRAEAS